MRGLRLAYLLLSLLVAVPLSAQRQRTERTDSLVRLLGCDELRQRDERGKSIRMALGHARFEHNATMLLCDTAYWRVDDGIINAFGNVRIIQNETILSSEKLDYLVESNLAQFRGTVVQLQDKKRNTLRTSDLDYNTQDSVATFRRGGSFRDQDGQVIESETGSYDSKKKEFMFMRDVNMYTDSIFIKTDVLTYNTETSVALLGTGTCAWKGEDYMLSSKSGRYERAIEHFLFTREVHLQTRDQEAWCDSLHYWRLTNDALMRGHVALLDTTREVMAVARSAHYVDSARSVTLERDAAVMGIDRQESVADTTYIGADMLVYWTVPKCDLDSSTVRQSRARLSDMSADPVTAYRQKAAEEARAKAEKARKEKEQADPNAAAARDRGRQPNLPGPDDGAPAPAFFRYIRRPQPPDSLALRGPLALRDSLHARPDSSLALRDSTSAGADSTVLAPRDTTPVAFLKAVGHVKIFRKDMQAVCDSLAFTGLDSLARMYKGPVVWNEVRRQYSSDSIYVLVRNQSLEKASLMSSAFIIVQEDSLCFDQIRGAEMLAFFDSTGALTRFDALGGASGLFYIEENDAFATVNKFEAKMFTARMKDGDIHDINYFEDVKSDAFPVVQLRRDERELKGYQWQPERRPATPSDVTSLQPRRSEREKYEKMPRPKFKYTEKYFPGYMDEVHKELARQDSLSRVRRAEQARRREIADSLAAVAADSLAAVAADSLRTAPDSLAAAPDSLSSGRPRPDKPAADSLDVKPSVDAPQKAPADSLPALSDTLSPEQRAERQKQAERERKRAEQEQKKAEREQKRKARIDAREAKWAELDARDAAKEAAKQEKRLRKQRIKTRKTLQAVEKREAKEQKIIARYKERYMKQKEKKEAKGAEEKKSEADNETRSK